jgi:aryl-alcohol dehydrogenase-like predicted oxidoreductase
MKLVLGTVQFGLDYGINNSGGKPSLEKTNQVLNQAYLAGIKELDTADAYGNSTEVISKYLANNPTQPFKLMSKFINNGGKKILDYFNHSCELLGVDHLEGYYFHHFEDFKLFNEQSVVRKLKEEGRLKKLAVSLYSLEDLKLAVESSDVDLIQIPFNLFDCSEEKRKLLIRAKDLGKMIYVRSVFLQGLFFKDIKSLPERLLPLKENLTLLNNIAKTHQLSLEDLCLGFINNQSFVDKIIIGVDSVEQLNKNINSAKILISNELTNEIYNIKIDHPNLIDPVNWN